jgi:hypothetical protein
MPLGTLNGHRPIRLMAVVLALLLWAGEGAERAQGPDEFARLVTQLSEPDGYFDTDNLISNEKSYLHVLPELRKAGINGQVYIGVGPDQNFSYIAELRPALAFIVDIRRDNLLLHLLFKALFHQASSRVEYLCLLTGRPVPENPREWRTADVTALAAHVDATAATPATITAARSRVDAAIRRFGVGLSSQDWQTLERFHRTFIERGLSLKFQSTGRPPRSYYPTYRELLLESEAEGRQSNYLASEERFHTVRSLQQQDLVIPVVGDLGGPHALPEIGRLMARRKQTLGAFYTSNVEFYLIRGRRLEQFVENMQTLPRTERSVIIRAVFYGSAGLAEARPGYHSTSLVRPVAELIDGFAGGAYRHPLDLAARSPAAPRLP